MRRIGFALSGGGFRATLYHLGLVRFLRDAGILPSVTHITSVSGGSILAAHLVLNWERYNGSPAEFDRVASELLDFVRLDVRNRIARRFPLLVPARLLRRLMLRRPNRRLTRTGLLEAHYEQRLYGDTSLFQLPERPQLHILATNLSEGRLCSFTRDGLLMQRRRSGSRSGFDLVRAGLATVPMAVAASSAFPGFFPPIELTGRDVGASDGEFGRQSFTDGGVFDNLGVRMFRCMERLWDAADLPLAADDFCDLEAAAAALRAAGSSGEETPLRRVAQLLAAQRERPDRWLLRERLPSAAAGQPPLAEVAAGESLDRLVALLDGLMAHYPLQREPLFSALSLENPDAAALLESERQGGPPLGAGEQRWLNRRLLEAAFRQVTGQPCFRRLRNGLDGVLVSDVGKPFQVLSSAQPAGMIRTALRATDILMDRVWQLEKETFEGTPGFVFAPITAGVDPSEDPTAPHPEIQRQAAGIRTDLDRFSTLEIQSLTLHGYCVGRMACRTRPDLFGAELPSGPPWDPTLPAHGKRSGLEPRATAASAPDRAPAPTTVDARKLHQSAQRRIWSTLLDWRDWTTFLYVPLLAPILVLAPYFAYRAFERSQRINQLVQSIIQNSRDFQEMSRRLEDGPAQPFVGVRTEEVPQLATANLGGFLILQDTQIVDMRRVQPGAAAPSGSAPLIYGYRRLRVARRPETAGDPVLRVQLEPNSPHLDARFPPQQLQPTLRKSKCPEGKPGAHLWELSVDFRSMLPNESVDVLVEYFSNEDLHQGADGGGCSLDFAVQAQTAEKSFWVLMPQGKEYHSYRLVRYQAGKPETAEGLLPVSDYMEGDFTILAFKLLSLSPGYTYEIRWTHKE